jgi:S1-C subfamily serine protease
VSRRCCSLRVACVASLLFLARPSSAQPVGAAHAANALRELNNSVEGLVRRVSPAVVQILATGYGRREGAESDSPFDIVRQRSVGSGVVIDAAGYIVTNAHVVAGAVRLQVVVAEPDGDETPCDR